MLLKKRLTILGCVGETRDNTFLFVSNLNVKCQLQYFYSVLQKEEDVPVHVNKGISVPGVLE